jgi:hypothetical protein
MIRSNISIEVSYASQYQQQQNDDGEIVMNEGQKLQKSLNPSTISLTLGTSERKSILLVMTLEMTCYSKEGRQEVSKHLFVTRTHVRPPARHQARPAAARPARAN